MSGNWDDWYRGNITEEERNRIGYDNVRNEVKVGDKVVCYEPVGYCGGQDEDDKIGLSEIVTIEYIEEGNNCAFFKEHPERYGPWNLVNFLKII